MTCNNVPHPLVTGAASASARGSLWPLRLTPISAGGAGPVLAARRLTSPALDWPRAVSTNRLGAIITLPWRLSFMSDNDIYFILTAPPPRGCYSQSQCDKKDADPHSYSSLVKTGIFSNQWIFMKKSVTFH